MDIELLPCGLCGSKKGYTLSEGNTYRWWDVTCKGCGRIIEECASDRRMKFGTPLPERWESADEVWNQAGEYADSLRQQLAKLAVEPLIEALRFYADTNKWYVDIDLKHSTINCGDAASIAIDAIAAYDASR